MYQMLVTISTWDDGDAPIVSITSQLLEFRTIQERARAQVAIQAAYAATNFEVVFACWETD